MAQCLACKGGYAPNDAHTTCEQCAVGFYRSFYTKRCGADRAWEVACIS